MPAGRIRSDLTGQEFACWTVTGPAPSRGPTIYWLCTCKCGTSKEVEANSLRRGLSKSCGCLPNQRHKTHGMRHTPTYNSWVAMRQRCYDPGSGRYERYGAVGVTVCDRWRNSFEDFLADVGVRPTSKHSLDRKDGTKGYEPGNCEWATSKQQALNRKSTRWFTHDGKTLCLKDWCRERGLNRKTVTSRLRTGWEMAEALELTACQ
jgi:hypothetical protein